MHLAHSKEKKRKGVLANITIEEELECGKRCKLIEGLVVTRANRMNKTEQEQMAREISAKEQNVMKS